MRRTAESAKAGNYAAGLIAARAELAYAESHFGEHGVSTAQALCELVELELLSGEFSEARKDDGRAIAITEAKGHGADELLATALTGFAGVLAHLGDYAGAEIRYRRALEPREAPLVIDPVQHATTLCGLASTLSAQG